VITNIRKTSVEVVKKEPPKNVFCIEVRFDTEIDGGTLRIFNKDKDEVVKLLNLYALYVEKLKFDWNTWCNPETEQLIDLAKSIGVFSSGLEDEYIDNLYNIWLEDDEYRDSWARVEKYTVTYFDDNGHEFKCVVITD